MTAQSRNVLKSYFQRGLRPTEAQYGNLIDSFSLISSSAEFVQKSGDTMTGVLYLSTSPSAAAPGLQAANKQYIDDLVAGAAALFGVGGSNGQIQYNNNGVFGGFTVSGDAASLASTGVLTLANTAVSAGTYPAPNVTIDSKGRVTSASTISVLSNSLSSDVNISDSTNYFDGPTVSQGTSGRWLVTGTVTLDAPGTGDIYFIRLWDGTTTIASTLATSNNGTQARASVSGVLSSPAGNLRISVRCTSATNTKISFNSTGLSKDSTITAIQIG